MAEETSSNVVSVASHTFCPCGAVMSHVEWEGMWGWLCPECGNFIPDPI